MATDGSQRLEETGQAMDLDSESDKPKSPSPGSPTQSSPASVSTTPPTESELDDDKHILPFKDKDSMASLCTRMRNTSIDREGLILGLVKIVGGNYWQIIRYGDVNCDYGMERFMTCREVKAMRRQPDFSKPHIEEKFPYKARDSYTISEREELFHKLNLLDEFAHGGTSEKNNKE
ncbi:hypothetical protein FHETE_11382, partial [Fusarium heterosporum]